MQVLCKQSSRVKRVILVLGAFAYVTCFNWMYMRYLYPEFDYLGFDYSTPSTTCVLVAWILAILPSLWMPLRISRASHISYWVLYVTVLIPSMFTPIYAGLNRSSETVPLVITLFAGFVLVGLSYRVPLARLHYPKLNPRTFWTLGGALVFTLTCWLLVVYRGHIHLVGFSDIYDLRYAADDVSEGSNVNYAFMLMTGAVGPFLMAYGLFRRLMWCFIGGACCELFIYSIAGTKGSVLSILFIPGMYLVLTATRLSFGIKFLFGSLITIAVTFLSYLAVGRQPGILHRVALFLILCRTLSINGLATAQYYDFFAQNPWTHYSHLHVVNLFIHYPYSYPIGVELGIHYAGTTDLDATAHFWAMDGLAALGLSGVLVISSCCACVFWLLDSIASRHDARFGALVVTYAAYNLANIGLFTSLLSGGLGLLMLVLYCLPDVRASSGALGRTSPRLA